MKIAIINSERIVENILEADSLEQVRSLGISGDLMDVTELSVSVGQEYSNSYQKFIPLNFRYGFIFNEDLWKWIPPEPAPEDATWITDLQEKPEGHDELAVKRIYFWMDKYNGWGLAACSCNPKPADGYYWNPLEKEWQLPDSEKPEGDYVWNAIEKTWLEIPTPLAE